MAVKHKVRAKRKVKSALRRITPEEKADVLKEVREAVEVEAKVEADVPMRIPGKVVMGQKTTYTERDLIDLYGLTTFTPDETVPVTLQGIRYQLITGVEMVVPTEIYRIYLRHKKARREAGASLPRDSGYATEVVLGGGALPPE